MANLDEANVEKKFRGVSGTQENIQSLALWVLHHKASHEKIVDIWFRVLKKSKMPHRLTLFYLCNDIVQNCKRKHALCYKDQFKEVLKDATLLVRDNTIRPNIERLFTIWAERNVYDKEYAEELKSILNNTKIRANMSSKLLTEFKPSALVELIVRVKRYEDEVELRRRQVINLRLDASSIEAIKQLKDRRHGEEFMNKFEDSCSKLSEFVSKVEQEIKDRTALIEMLEQSELFYDAQHGEAKIVANAYKNFGTRVSNLRKRLDEHKKSLPGSLSPVPSPPQPTDVPSPADSPEPTGVDNTEMIDMEMSDEEGEMLSAHKSVGSQLLVAKTNLTRSYSQPIASVTEITMKSNKQYLLDDQKMPHSINSPQQKSLADNSSGSGALDVGLPGLIKGAQSTFLGSLMGMQLDSTDSESSTPNQTWTPEHSSKLSDTVSKLSSEIPLIGESTPVMDEPPDTDDEEQKDNLAGSSQPNAMDFLTQLINQSNKASPQGSASASFFKNVQAMLSSSAKMSEETSQDQTSEETSATEGAYNSSKHDKQWDNWDNSGGQSSSASELDFPMSSTHHESQKSPQVEANKEKTDILPPMLPPPKLPTCMENKDQAIAPSLMQTTADVTPFSSPPNPPSNDLLPPKAATQGQPPTQLPHNFPSSNFSPRHPPPQRPNLSPPAIPGDIRPSIPRQEPPGAWSGPGQFPKQNPADNPRFNLLRPPPPPPPPQEPPFVQHNSSVPPPSVGGQPALQPPPRPPRLDQFMARMPQPPRMPVPPGGNMFNIESSSAVNIPSSGSSISVIGGGNSDPSNPFMFPPPPRPPVQPAVPDVVASLLPSSSKPKHDPLAEVQEEFIQQLKRKSSASSSNTGPNPKRTVTDSSEDDGTGFESRNLLDTSGGDLSTDTSEVKRTVEAETVSSVPPGDSHPPDISDSHGPRPSSRRSSSDDYGSYNRGGGGSRDWHNETKSHSTDSHGGHRDGYMSERDRWAYEMAKQQYYKDMYGYGSYSKRPRPPPPPFSRGYHNKY